MAVTGQQGQQFLSRLAPISTRLALSDQCGDLSSSVNRWLRKRRKGVKPKLTTQQTDELQNVFQLMDGDGSGSIDAQELGAAFKLLGFDLHASEVQAMVQEVDRDQTGEVEYNEFLEIMTETVLKMSENSHAGGSQVPFGLLATAYRRKKLLGGILDGTAASLAKVVKVGEDEERERGRESEVAARKRRPPPALSSTLLLAAQRCQLSPSLLKGMHNAELRAVATVNMRPKRGAGASTAPLQLPALAQGTYRRGVTLSALQEQLSRTLPRLDLDRKLPALHLQRDRCSSHLGIASIDRTMRQRTRLVLSEDEDGGGRRR